MTLPARVGAVVTPKYRGGRPLYGYHRLLYGEGAGVGRCAVGLLAGRRPGRHGTPTCSGVPGAATCRSGARAGHAVFGVVGLLWSRGWKGI